MVYFFFTSKRGAYYTMEPVEIPIGDVLDLHTFKPKDIPDLLQEYFDACIAKGIFAVRIIHGKGHGILKKRVESHLKKNPMVATFRGAPPEAGGWGATLVELKPSRFVNRNQRPPAEEV
jgi:DNA-nicking Smr family endonuclease